MEKNTNFFSNLFGSLAGYVEASILFNKIIPRPKGTSEDITAEFADPEKMKEYAAKMAPVGEWMEKQKMEDIYVTSRDGLRLHAYYIPVAEKSDKLVLVHHGFTSEAKHNSVHAKFFHEMGYEVILLDLRAHGESEGQYVGFGILDRFDTLKWIEYINGRFGTEISIVLHGTSMGAATVLMALGLPEVRDRVSAVIADCAYTSPAEVFAHVMERDYHISPFPIVQANELMEKHNVGYRFDEYSTIDALHDNKDIPVMFIHGAEDSFVPTSMSFENYKACETKKKLLIVEHAGHASSVFENTELYESAEREFLEEIFS